jgi:hypothetical protein
MLAWLFQACGLYAVALGPAMLQGPKIVRQIETNMEEEYGPTELHEHAEGRGAALDITSVR